VRLGLFFPPPLFFFVMTNSSAVMVPTVSFPLFFYRDVFFLPSFFFPLFLSLSGLSRACNDDKSAGASNFPSAPPPPFSPPFSPYDVFLLPLFFPSLSKMMLGEVDKNVAKGGTLPQAFPPSFFFSFFSLVVGCAKGLSFRGRGLFFFSFFSFFFPLGKVLFPFFFFFLSSP